MKFSTTEDIDASLYAVWAAVTDFGAFERSARKRGADVRALTKGETGLGAAWSAQFGYHGVERTLECMISGFEPPRRLEADSHAGGVEGYLTVELRPLAVDATRLGLSLELRPANLPGRLLLQTLALARGSLTRRFTSAVHRFATEIAQTA